MARKLIIKDKDNEIIYPETLSNLVYNEVTGNTVEDDLENMESGLLQLSETDGDANKEILSAALAQGDVKLKKGVYPVENGVIVDNVTLDLNGACLHPVTRKSTGLLIMKGKFPVIKNGELYGSFNVDNYTPSGDSYESESLIRLQLYENALVENVELHNDWGYAISTLEPTWDVDAVRKGGFAVTAVSSSTELSSESNEYVSAYITIPSGYLYTCAYGGVGYNYIISRGDVKYSFYDDSNTFISSVSNTPRIMVAIPSNATKMKIRTSSYDDYIQTNVGFYKINVNCFTVNNCCFHNNRSLGMIGMPYGITKVLNCTSYEQGKPKKDSARNTNTTGFIDIEDYASPIFIMDNCTSEDEIHLAMLGAYKIHVSNCVGSIGVYRGWNANITNCTGTIWAISEYTLTNINVSNCTFYRQGTESINWIGTNNTFINCHPSDFSKEFNFTFIKTHKTTGDLTPKINTRVVGKMFNPCTRTGNAGISLLSVKKGSKFTIAWCPGFATEFEYYLDKNGNKKYYLDDEGLHKPSNGKVSEEGTVTDGCTYYTFKPFDSNSYGTMKVYGNSYGITSTVPIYPNSYTIHDSVFKPIGNFGAGTAEDDSWTGEYENCTFNLSRGCMFYASSKKLTTDNGQLIFRNCTINNTNNYLFKSNMTNLSGKTYNIKFINCTIADETKLFASTPSTFTYEIITEDLDYDSRIKALEERIRQLEENS